MEIHMNLSFGKLFHTRTPPLLQLYRQRKTTVSSVPSLHFLLLVKDIFDTLKKIKEEGTTILIVEQNALQTLKIADYGYVLELGTVNMQGPASELITNEKLVEAYLGGKK